MTGGSSTRLVRPRTVLIGERVSIGPGVAQQSVEFVARLRDLASATTDVIWSSSIAADFDVAPVVHLPPPQPDLEWDAAVERWRAAHRPAMCYYRVGPGFIEVKDTRQANVAARFLLDDPTLIDAFNRCLCPCRYADLAPAEQEAAKLMSDEGLLLCLSDWITTLPSRMRRWPVPSQIV